MSDFDLIESILGIAETGRFDRATDVMAHNIAGCVGLHCSFTSASGARRQMAYSMTPEVVGERLKTDFLTPQDNPMIAGAHRLPIGKLTMVERFVDMDAYLESQLYQEMIEPYDTPYISTILLPGRHGMVSFGLGQRDGMTELSLQKAETMAFHVARALDLYMGSCAPDRNAFLVDPAGCLVGQSDFSVARVTEGALRQSYRGGPIRPVMPDMVPAFEKALATVGETGRSQRMICPNGHGVPVVVTVSPGPPDGIRNVVWVHLEKAQRLEWTQDELRAIHNLTKREATVVDAFLAGADIPTAARTLGLSERSVRTYLSNVFSKMGVSSQIELLRTLLGPQ